MILLICLLCLNLFVGVIIQSFYEEKEALSRNFLLKRVQIAWIKVQLQAYSSTPIMVIKENLENVSCFRNMLIKLTTHKAFDIFIISSILGNTIILALNWYGMPE